MSALAKYDFKVFIPKKEMTKEERVEFFAIELPQLIRAIHMSSLIIWYARHGQFIYENGYWIPVDANFDIVSSFLIWEV